jgi:lipopolysaccharide biosynthesis glycosyltransferase
MKKIYLVSAGDDAFSMPIAVMLFSVMYHLDTNYNLSVTILDNGITEANQKNIRRVLSKWKDRMEVNFVRISLERIQDLKTVGWLQIETYSRLFIPEFFVNDIQKLIYIDGDILLHRSLSELYDDDMEGNTIMAVQDYGIVQFGSPLGIPEICKAENLDVMHKMFNAGLMVIDLNKWRENNISDAVINITRKYQAYIRYADQDGLNACLAGQWKELDPRWNVQVGAVLNWWAWPESNYKQSMQSMRYTYLAEAYATHYTSARKPWIVGLTNPVRSRFHHYLKKSQWHAGASYLIWKIQWFMRCMNQLPTDIIQRFKR